MNTKGDHLIEQLKVNYKKTKNRFLNNNNHLNFFLLAGILFFTIPLGSLLSSELTHTPNTLLSTPQFIAPYHGSYDIDINTTLEWQCNTPTDDISHYTIFFGNNPDPPESITQKNNTYILLNLEYETTYFWKISVFDNYGNSKTSFVFNFTTRPQLLFDETNQEKNRPVFVEFGAAVWAQRCPRIKEMIHDLYLTDNYHFNYVSLICDQNEKAYQRLAQEYNNDHHFPGIYIDGGYFVLDLPKDTDQDKKNIEEKILQSALRPTPNVDIYMHNIIFEETNECQTFISIQNNEEKQYTGRLRVYLVEKISRWHDYNGRPFYNAFIDYIIEKEVTIQEGKDIEISQKWSLSHLDKDNLKIIAVLFTNNAIEKDSNPSDPGHYHGFQAHYVDASVAVDIIEDGILPPQTGIEYPKKFRINIFNNAYFRAPFRRNTILIGPMTLIAYAEDEVPIEKVEFYINDELIKTVTEEPYTYTLRKIGWRRHLIKNYTLTVTAYSTSGKHSSTHMDILAIFK